MNENSEDLKGKETVKTIKKTLKSLKIKVSENSFKLEDHNYKTTLQIKGFYQLEIYGNGPDKNSSRISAYQRLIEGLSSRSIIDNNFLGKEKSIISFQDEVLSPNIHFERSFISQFFEEKPKTFMEDAIKYRIASPFKTIDKKEEYLPIKLIQETTHSAGLSSGGTVEEAIEKGILEITTEKPKKNKIKYYYKDYSYLGYPVVKVFIPNLSIKDPIKEEEKDLLMNYELIRDIYFDIQKDYPKAVIEECMNSIKKVLSYEKYTSMNLGTFFHSHYYLKTNYNHLSFELFYVLLNYKIKKTFQDVSLLKDETLKNYLKDLDEKIIEDKTYYILKELECSIPSCPNCSTCECRKICKYKNWNKLNENLKKKEVN